MYEATLEPRHLDFAIARGMNRVAELTEGREDAVVAGVA